MQTRPRWFRHLVTLGVVLVATGCDARPEAAGAAPVADRVVESAGFVADCVRDDYPCTWADVPDSTRARSYRIGQLVADFLAVADSIPQVVAVLDSIDGISEVAASELGIRFRLAGSRAIWVALPNDSTAYRLSAPLAPAPGALRPLAALRPAILPVVQGAGERAGVTGRPDSMKQALFVAPYAWESGIYDGAVGEEFANERVTLALALQRGNLELRRRISRGQDVGARSRFTDDPDEAINTTMGDANVSLASFKSWDDYSYVYLTTHGLIATRDGVRMTYLYAGQVAGDVVPNHLDPYLGSSLYREALGEPGVEFSFGGRTGMISGAGGLTPGEIQNCLFQDFVARAQQIRDAAGDLRASESAPGKADGPRCYVNIDPTLQVGVTTEFFRRHYPRGVTNTWIFLVACESMALGDLGDVFTNNGRNRNVAVMGFNRPVSSLFVRPLSRVFTWMVGAGYGIHTIVDSLQTAFPNDQLVGVMLGKPGAVSARLTPSISNPSFAPDVVSLVDPATGQEVVDGGHVQLAGTAGDGAPDSLRLVRQIALLDQRVSADAVKLRVEVAGRGKGTDLVPTLAGNAEDFFRVEPDASDLGFDVRKNERLDLTVVATFPGGGESRWTYRDLSFAGCSWSLNVAGSSRNGTYRGSHATYMDLGEKIVVNIGGTGADGNVITLAIPGVPAGGSRTVEIGARSSETMASFGFGDPGNGNPTQMMFVSGDGSAMRGPNGNVVDHQPGPSTLTVRRSADGTLTGRLSGRAWTQKSMQDYTLDKPGVELRFTAQEWMSMAVLGGKRDVGMADIQKLMAEEPC